MSFLIVHKASPTVMLITLTKSSSISTDPKIKEGSPSPAATPEIRP